MMDIEQLAIDAGFGFIGDAEKYVITDNGLVNIADRLIKFAKAYAQQQSEAVAATPQWFWDTGFEEHACVIELIDDHLRDSDIADGETIEVKYGIEGEATYKNVNGKAELIKLEPAYYTTPQPDRVAELEAKLKVAVDALKYYEQTNASYGFMAKEAIAKIKD